MIHRPMRSPISAIMIRTIRSPSFAAHKKSSIPASRCRWSWINGTRAHTNGPLCPPKKWCTINQPCRPIQGSNSQWTAFRIYHLHRIVGLSAGRPEPIPFPFGKKRNYRHKHPLFLCLIKVRMCFIHRRQQVFGALLQQYFEMKGQKAALTGKLEYYNALLAAL